MEVLLAEVRLPRVGVRVELDECEWAMTLRKHAQLGEGDRVVAAERNGEDSCLDDRCQSLDDLRIRALGVAGRNRQIAVIHDRERVDDVEVVRRVVRTDERRGGTNRLRSEPRAGAVARRGVEGNPVDRRVDSGKLGHVRRAHVRPDPREARDHLRIERLVRRARHAHTLPPARVRHVSNCKGLTPAVRDAPQKAGV